MQTPAIGRSARPRLTAGPARNRNEIEEAQRLRYLVFAEEGQASLPGCGQRIDRDRYDEHCTHLLLRDEDSGAVVGTYRLLNCEGARAAGGFYSEGEFDMKRIAHLMPWTVETGRACVHPTYRSAFAITMLWSALIRHIFEQGYLYVMGCASIETRDGDGSTAAICSQLLSNHLSSEELRVYPHREFDYEGHAAAGDVQIPGLIRAYLKLGARVCGKPAWDPDFKTADLLLLLPLAEANTRYVERFLRAA